MACSNHCLFTTGHRAGSAVSERSQQSPIELQPPETLPSVNQKCIIVLALKWLLSCSRITTFLDNIDVGDYYVHGDLEAYSCEMKQSAACFVSCESTPVCCAFI